MKKQTKKIIKKTSTPKKEIFVNLCDINDVEDVKWYVAIGKCNAGIPITEEDLNMAYARGANDCVAAMDTMVREYINSEAFMNQVHETSQFINNMINEHYTPKKTPWYKKLWNKITGIFKRK